MTKKNNNKRIDKKLEQKKELQGYLRTAAITFGVAFLLALILIIHARNEMIKNLYVNKDEKLKIEKQLAQKIVSQSDLIESLNDKSYSVCIQVGRLYETAEDFIKAEYAYNLAIMKAPQGVYTPYYRQIVTLIALDKIDKAESIVASVEDISNVNLIKFKTRAYITLGDKYYSIGKFLKAAKSFEKADYYYSRFSKKDAVIVKSIQKRLVNAYLQTASVLVKNGYSNDAVKFLKKSLEHEPNNLKIQYRLAIVYADLDPIEAVKYFEPLIEKIPQEIDYSVYTSSLMKAANIEDLNGNNIKAKYYRYKVRTLDTLISQKVIYKKDIITNITDFAIKKSFFKYKVRAKVKFQNISPSDILKMSAEFVLRHGNNIKESAIVNCVNRKHPLFSNGGETEEINIEFGKNILTKRELENYYIDIYVFKDEKFKTLIQSFKLPVKNKKDFTFLIQEQN